MRERAGEEGDVRITGPPALRLTLEAGPVPSYEFGKACDRLTTEGLLGGVLRSRSISSWELIKEVVESKAAGIKFSVLKCCGNFKIEL